MCFTCEKHNIFMYFSARNQGFFQNYKLCLDILDFFAINWFLISLFIAKNKHHL